MRRLGPGAPAAMQDLMQDLLALAVAALAAGWLARTILRRLTAPPCRPPSPGGGDGFVPLDELTGIQKPGRP